MFPQHHTHTLESTIQSGYRYACALQADSSEAQDIVHEAWIRASKEHGSVPNKAFLFRCIRNIYIDRYRRSQTVQFSAFDDMGSFVGDLDVKELPDAQLQRALVKLRGPEREALFLFAVEEYTAEEISKLVGKPRGTILSLIHRARIKLKTLMLEDDVNTLRRNNSRVTT